ncbi:hypothetical protein [Rhizobium laguerreae]|uniref:hypothetical protein n=1 Tax=Rhizobium laguerreae TaxID=1076926 RepID=UPI001C91743D|nr:hypothetical protein [Rhizobium laguerreae]
MVESICRLLQITPSAYYENVDKRLALTGCQSARSDIALKIEIRRVFEANFRVYGLRKVWRNSRRKALIQAAAPSPGSSDRLGLQGIIRGKPIRTRRLPPA